MTDNKKGGLFLTSAKGIQGFIMATDALRDMVGGSEIVAQLPEQALKVTREQLLAADSIRGMGEVLIQAAGGATVFFDRLEDAEKLAEVWPVVATLFAPGLEVVQTVVACDRSGILAAVEEGEKRLMFARQAPMAALPEAGPLVERNRRSGLPATETREYKPRKSEAMDAGLTRKLDLAPGAQKELLRPILPEAYWGKIHCLEQFPLDFNKIVTEDNAYLAVIHIDVNGLGQLRMNLGDNLPAGREPIDALKRFSDAVQESTRNALREALLPLMNRVRDPSEDNPYPFRPIVCAGDDVTMVMHAPGAMEFTRIFLEAFERASKNRKSDLGLAENASLTACAGVAFVKKSFPYALAYELCESLCKHAKDATGRNASAIAFHRVSTSNATTYGRIVEKELTVREEERHPRLLTMNPYLAGIGVSIPGFPHVRDLEALAEIVAAKLPKSAIRNVIGEMYREQRDRSDKAMARLLSVQKGRNEQVHNAFHNALHKLTDGDKTGCDLWRLPPDDDPNPRIRSPLLDVQEIIAVGAMEDDQDNPIALPGGTVS